MLMAAEVAELGSGILGGGVVAAVLTWFMTKHHKSMEENRVAIQGMRDAMDRATKGQLLQLLVHPKFPEEGKQIANNLLAEIEAKK